MKVLLQMKFIFQFLTENSTMIRIISITLLFVTVNLQNYFVIYNYEFVELLLL